jgi:hypothetical protein
MSLSHHRYSQVTGIPCAMVLTVSFVLFPGTGLFCPRHRRDAKHPRQFGASIGAPEPHDFAVRVMAVRLSTWPRPSHPASRFVTIAHTPLLPRQDGPKARSDLPDGESEKFFAQGLDSPNRLERPRQIRFLAHALFMAETPRGNALGRAYQSTSASFPKRCTRCKHRNDAVGQQATHHNPPHAPIMGLYRLQMIASRIQWLRS